MDPDDDGFHQPLLNLSKVRSRMDHVQRFLTESLNSNTLLQKSQMDLVSHEITAAINQIIVNGTALISSSSSRIPNSNSNSLLSTSLTFDLKNSSESDLNLKDDVDIGFPKTEVLEEEEEDIGGDWDIVELDAVELLAEHLHFCDFCGKGFKRDANLRMHMRAHGNKFKTLEALSKPIEKSITASSSGSGGRTRFSCPFTGCSRNKLNKKFRPLKSVICVKNHFKRSHCPKMYSCNRCNKKNFSVLADLKSHLKHCGETKWKCSCGTSFSRKDKLFGHMALFEGHMPAVPPPTKVVVPAPTTPVVVVDDDDNDDDEWVNNNGGKIDDMFFDGLGSIDDDDDDFCIQDLLAAASNTGFDWNL